MAARAAAAERRAFRAGSSQDQGTENAGSAVLNQENELEDVEGGGVDDDDIDYSYDDADDDDSCFSSQCCTAPLLSGLHVSVAVINCLCMMQPDRKSVLLFRKSHN